MEANTDVKVPIIRVVAKLFIGPWPKTKSTTPVINVVAFESMIAG